jgi:REP element-mobilizing transposase RayT
MEQSNDEPKRKRLRAEWNEYNGGAYFITICTHEKLHYFGHIANSKMSLSEIGKYVEKELDGAEQHYKYVKIPLYTIMPNHVHAIVVIRTTAEDERHGLLSKYIAGFKAAVSRYASRNNITFGWQRSYYDRMIRNNREGNQYAQYIETNIIRWKM